MAPPVSRPANIRDRKDPLTRCSSFRSGGCVETIQERHREDPDGRASAVHGCRGGDFHQACPEAPAIRLVVLDVGGTIIEDRGDVPETLRSGMGNHGVTVTLAEISEWRGASKREIIRHFVERQNMPPGADREQLVTAMYQDFNARLGEIYRTVPPIAGAEDAIRKLRQS